MRNHPMYSISRPDPNTQFSNSQRSYPLCELDKSYKIVKHIAIGLIIVAISLTVVLIVSITLIFTIGLKIAPLTTVAESSHSKNLSFNSLYEPCTCGCPSIEPLFHETSKTSSRIINGQEARAHSWPWQILVLVYDMNRQPLSYCGATLITQRHILTAAHCVHQHMPPFVYVFPGQDIFNFSIHPTSGYVVNRIYIHEGYNVLLHHDLAILTIDQPLRFDSYIRPICLATPGSSLLQANEELIAIGWGRVSAVPGTQIYAQHLRQVNLTYVPTSHPNCSGIFRPITNIHPGQMCAGKPGYSACQGDSGGPLMRRVHISNTDTYYWEQIGVASKTIDCGWNSTWPDIYINIPYYHDWIMTTIKRAN